MENTIFDVNNDITHDDVVFVVIRNTENEEIEGKFTIMSKRTYMINKFQVEIITEGSKDWCLEYCANNECSDDILAKIG